jgi:hypothetical protein
MHRIAKEHGIEDLEKFVNEHKHELKWFKDRAAAKALQAQRAHERPIEAEPTRVCIAVADNPRPPDVVLMDGSGDLVEVCVCEQPAMRGDEELYAYTKPKVA